MARSYRAEHDNMLLNKTDELLGQLPDYVAYYIASLAGTTESNTRLEYTRDIYRFFEYISDAMGVSPVNVTCKMLDTLKATDFEAYMVYIRAYEKDGVVYRNENKALARKFSSLRGFFNYLFEHDMMQTNNFSRVKSPRVKKDNSHEINRLDNEELGEFFDEVEFGSYLNAHAERYHDIQKDRDLAIMAVLAGTGIRISECAGLDMDDINLRKHYIQVIRKGNKRDVVYMGDETQQILEVYLKQREAMNQSEDAMKRPLPGHERALFLSSRRGRLSVRAMQQLVSKYAERTGLGKHVSAHTLRRSFGTELYLQSGDLLAVSKALGHNSPATAQQYYINSSGVKEHYRNSVHLRDITGE